MALQSFTITIGALTDAGNNGKNYVNNQPVYIKKANGTLASIYRDLAGTSQITQDGLSNVTNSKGQFTFFVEAGDYNAEYQSQVTPITVVGADYFNNRIDETVNQIILDLSTSRGFRVKGTFAAGFTYELPNDVGVDGSGNYWIYTNADALPFAVPAATTPSAPTYTQVTFNQASNISYTENGDAEEALRKRAGYYTLAEAQSADLEINQYVIITDYDNAMYKVVNDTDTNGLYKDHNTAGLKLRLIDELGFLNTAGYVSDTTGATIVYSQLNEMVENAKLTGLALISRPSDVYNVGGFPDTSDLSKFIINTDKFTWQTNGCEFTLQANTNAYHDGRASQILFEVEANDIDIGDIKVTADTIARDGSERQGVQAYWFNNSTRNTRNNKIGEVIGEKLISCVVATSSNPDSFRLRGLTHGKLFNNSGYYVLNCAGNADNVSGICSSNDCIRTWFCYGVTGYEHKVETYNHLRFTDIVIARISRDTSDITINYSCSLSNTSSGVISFEHLNDDSDSTISNVSLNFDVKVSNPANPTINFSSLTSAGVPEAITTKRYQDIRIKGKTNSTTPIDLKTTISGESPNSIYIERDDLIGNRDTKGFNFILGTKRMAFSDSSGGMAAEFNVSDLKFVPSWGKLSVFATNDWASGAGTANYLQRDYKVSFSVGGDGSVIPNVQSLRDDLTTSTLTPTVTFPTQSAGSYKYVVEVNNFPGENALVKCFLELQTGIATV